MFVTGSNIHAILNRRRRRARERARARARAQSSTDEMLFTDEIYIVQMKYILFIGIKFSLPALIFLPCSHIYLTFSGQD